MSGPHGWAIEPFLANGRGLRCQTRTLCYFTLRDLAEGVAFVLVRTGKRFVVGSFRNGYRRTCYTITGEKCDLHGSSKVKPVLRPIKPKEPTSE